MRFNGNPTTINEFSIFLDKSNRKTSIYLYRFFGIYFIQANIFWHYAAMNIGQLSYNFISTRTTKQPERKNKTKAINIVTTLKPRVLKLFCFMVKNKMP